MSPPGGAQTKNERVLFVRCTREQFDRVRAEAERRGLSVNAFVRAVLIEECDFVETRTSARAKPL